jgi:replicative DNA helicase
MLFLDKVKAGKEGNNTGYPGGLPRLDSRVYNIQPSKMTSIVGGPKSGKTYFMLYRYILSPWLSGVRNITWFLFTLEVDKNQIIARMVSFFLQKRYGVRLSASKIFSMGDYKISDTLYEKIKSVYEKDINPLLEKIVIIEDSSVSNPTGIYKYMLQYLNDKGEFLEEQFSTFDDKNTLVKKTRVVGYNKFVPNEEVFIIIDSLGLMKREQNLTKKDNIDRWIDDYAVKLRNICGCSIINLHHLNRAVSGVDRFKLSGSQLHPTLDDIKDTSALGETSDIIYALFNPNVYAHIDKHFGYELRDWKGNYRSLHVLASRYCDMGLNSALIFDYESGMFIELPEAENKVALEVIKNNLKNSGL